MMSCCGSSMSLLVQRSNRERPPAQSEGVSIRSYDIIYRLIEDVEKHQRHAETRKQEKMIGKADILAVFEISKTGNIAGCRVVDGEIRRNGIVRVIRAGEKVAEGELASLKHEKENVREVRAGYECGLRIKGFNDVHVGDRIECIVYEEG